MVIIRTRNKITDFLMILAWASPFKQIYIFRKVSVYNYTNCMWPTLYHYDAIITHIHHALLAFIRTFLYYM